jgi:hypothetical protein
MPAQGKPVWHDTPCRGVPRKRRPGSRSKNATSACKAETGGNTRQFRRKAPRKYRCLFSNSSPVREEEPVAPFARPRLHPGPAPSMPRSAPWRQSEKPSRPRPRLLGRDVAHDSRAARPAAPRPLSCLWCISWWPLIPGGPRSNSRGAKCVALEEPIRSCHGGPSRSVESLARASG